MAKSRTNSAKSAPKSRKNAPPRAETGSVANKTSGTKASTRKNSPKTDGGASGGPATNDAAATASRNPFALAIPKNNPFAEGELRDILYTMMLSRRLDQKMLTLLKQGKSFFHIGASGHEAAQIAAAKALTPGKDWSYPYYRDLSYMLGMGMDSEGIMTNFLARADDVISGVRQMPQHYGRGARWVTIWRANEKKIPDFDVIIPSQVLYIPNK